MKTSKPHDLIDEASEESFPASDAPTWVAGDKAHPEVAHPDTKTIFSKKTLKTLTVNGIDYYYFSLPVAEEMGLKGLSTLPFTLKILLENLLRHEDGHSVTRHDIHAIIDWLENKASDHEIAYRPGRVLMQDFTGVPAVVDLAAMRAAVKEMGGDPEKINPLSPVDLVIDHSVQVEQFLVPSAFQANAKIEMERNYERYNFLRWGQQAFQNFRVVPPDTGICHQVNLEYLANVVWMNEANNHKTIYPDTLVGTDSHTTMINGLGVLGWGVGGIEAEAAMLGQPISMLIPKVVGVKLTGKLREGITTTDLVLVVTNMLRSKGVVGKFVEFFGSGLKDLSVADRATIGNMAPEYGATCGFFPVDAVTLDYLRLSGRDEQNIALVEAYAKAQGLWHDAEKPAPVFSEVFELDLSTIQPCLAGPRRPQDKVEFSDLVGTFDKFLADQNQLDEKNKAFDSSESFKLHHGDVVIAAITSCTNTSNPNVLIAAGLVAKKAIEKGLSRKPWVKTSFAPGSQVVSLYLEKTGLQKYLDQLGFTLVGYGCTTCIGNSGPLPEAVANSITQYDLTVSAVLSGNRNFEGRIHPQVKANWLASPPLVVIFSLIGNISINLEKDPVGHDQKGAPVYLKDLWPSNAEIAKEVAQITRAMFHNTYAHIFEGSEEWRAMKIPSSKTYEWQPDSTYIQHPPFFEGMKIKPEKLHDIKGAAILALLGDSVTTDHISPAGSIKADSPAGKYLLSKGVIEKDFNSLGARRGNHEVMMRGTFANTRIKNEMVPGKEGGFTKHFRASLIVSTDLNFSETDILSSKLPSSESLRSSKSKSVETMTEAHFPNSEILTIFDAAMRYQSENIPLVVVAGKEYGTGSSRDWAAKGPKLLGVVAVIAESFERIHRSNLIGMGILPLEFQEGENRKTLKLTGSEIIDIVEFADNIKPCMRVKVIIHRHDNARTEVMLNSRIDTASEVEYYKNGGILQYVIRRMLLMSSDIV